jgi:hypothetical protein
MKMDAGKDDGDEPKNVPPLCVSFFDAMIYHRFSESLKGPTKISIRPP